jgi:hypothetical protein
MRSLTAFWAIVALGFLVLVVPRLVRRFKVPARRRVPVRGGILRMRSPARYGIALGISALVPAGVLGGMAVRLFLGGRTGPLGLLEIGVATLAPLAVALHQFVAAFRQGFVVDEFGITRVGVLTKRRVRWGDVAKFVYNPMNRWFFVTVADGSHLWVPVETHGIADFAGIALLRLPAKALREDPLAREALEELAASESAG